MENPTQNPPNPIHNTTNVLNFEFEKVLLNFDKYTMKINNDVLFYKIVSLVLFICVLFLIFYLISIKLSSLDHSST